ncbi:hypothetical protein KEM55_002683 [Ascosphaera atra]|nr:hypothetical protein KEM55_002683 [Ascosphaera atra]
MPRPAARRTRPAPAKAKAKKQDGTKEQTDNAQTEQDQVNRDDGTTEVQQGDGKHHRTTATAEETSSTAQQNDTAQQAGRNGPRDQTPTRERAPSRAPSSAGSAIARHVIPSSANKIQRRGTLVGNAGAGAGGTTPSVRNFETSLLSNMKFRRRKPSILQLDDDDQGLDLDLSSELNSGDEDVFLDSESDGIGEPEAGDEGTPLKVGRDKANVRRSLLGGEVAVEQEGIAQRDGEGEREEGEKEKEAVPEGQTEAAPTSKQDDIELDRSSSPLSSPPASEDERRPSFSSTESRPKLTAENLSRFEAAPASAEEGEEATPARRRSRRLRTPPEDMHATMLPPASSSPLKSPMKSDSSETDSESGEGEDDEEEETEDEEAEGEEEGVDAESSTSKRTAKRKSSSSSRRAELRAQLPTAKLREYLLPKRKRRRVMARQRAAAAAPTNANSTGEGVLDISSDDGDGQEDHDVSIYLPTGKKTRGAKGKGKKSARQPMHERQRKADADLNASATAGSRKGRRRTYGRSRPEEPEGGEGNDAEKENDEHHDNESDASHDEAEEANGDDTAQGHHQQSPAATNDELLRQKRKFEEIWKWDMEFEDVPEDEGEQV